MLHSEQKELQSCNYHYFFLKEEHLNSICSAFEDFLSMSKYVKKKHYIQYRNLLTSKNQSKFSIKKCRKTLPYVI